MTLPSPLARVMVSFYHIDGPKVRSLPFHRHPCDSLATVTIALVESQKGYYICCSVENQKGDL